MLRCRSIRVEVRVLVNWVRPQGGVLSPLLWNMVVDGLLRRLLMSLFASLVGWKTSVEEYGFYVCTAAIRADKWQIHCDSLIGSFLYEHFFFMYCLILSVCLFVSSLIFQFFICVVHIRPDFWPACGYFISLTFNLSIPPFLI
jgi:hypothetical protein